MVRAAHGDAVGAAYCLGAVLATGVTWLRDRQLAEATLADLRARFPANVIDTALAEGTATPLKQVAERIQEELGEYTSLGRLPEGTNPGERAHQTDPPGGSV